MVNSISHSQPTNLGGVTPADFNVLSNEYFQDLDRYQLGLDTTVKEMASLELLVDYLNKGDPQMLSYALEKFELSQVISNEDVDRAAMQAWDRIKINLRRFQSDLFGYAKVIQSGADRLVERLEMLMDMASKANSKPFKEEITLKKTAKFSLNGSFQPKDIRPVLEDTNNVYDFLDKVLLNYMKQIDKLLQTVQPNQTFPEGAQVRFDLFTAGKWMKNFTPLAEPDDRFRTNAFVVRGITAQGEKALYYAGPPDINEEGTADWGYFINTIRTMRFRYIKVPNQVPVNESDDTIKVEAAMTIRQRIGYLLGCAKRIAARKGYDQKISTELRKIERSADKLRNAARQAKPQKPSGDPEADQETPAAVAEIVRDLTLIMNSTMRLVNEFNHAIAGQIRLIGALGFVADLELKAFEAPLEKPKPEIQDKLDT
jgi:hypothetical protein